MTSTLRSITKTEWIGVGMLIALGAALRLWQPDLGYQSLHTSRDLYRSLLLLRGVEFPLLGSELQYGGRVLGPLMYVICALPLAIRVSPVAVAVFIALVNIALLGVLWLFARAFFGRGVAFWTLAFQAVFPLEIAQLRFNWNPCFLPALTTGAMIGLLMTVVRRRVWHVLTLVAFIALGLQIHISMAELIVGAGVVMFVARVRVPWKVWAAAAAVVVVLFIPLIIHEATADRSGLVEVVKSPDTHRGWRERYKFNPNGIRNYFYHVRLQMNERGETLGFAYLQIVPLIGERWLGAGAMRVARPINAFGQVQLLFWVVGAGFCARQVWRNRRATPPPATKAGTNVHTHAAEGDDPTAPGHGSFSLDSVIGLTGRGEEIDLAEQRRRRKVLYLTLLVWQIVPVAVLSFFNYHGLPHEPPSLAPIRYYLVSYPAPFLTSALGVMVLAGWMGTQARVWTHRAATGLRARRFVFAVGGLLLASHIVFNGMYLTVLDRSGRFLPYQWPNLAPTMRSMMEIRDILLGEARLDRDAWYERTHGQHLGLWWFGESTFDWLITQDPRSVLNPPSDPRIRWLLFSPFGDVAEPELPESAEELRRWTLGDKDMTVLEYRVEDPATPVPDNTMLRNFYYQDERMRYLGPDAALREKGRD